MTFAGIFLMCPVWMVNGKFDSIDPEQREIMTLCFRSVMALETLFRSRTFGKKLDQGDTIFSAFIQF